MNLLMLGAGAGTMGILWIVVMFALLYFLMIRPQKKSQDKHRQMLNALKINDRIQTVGGITGYVRDINDSYVYIEVADGLVIELNRQYVAMVLPDDDNEEASAEYISEASEDVKEVEEAEPVADTEEKEEAPAEEKK